MLKKIQALFLIIFIINSAFLFAQIKITELPQADLNKVDSIFFDLTKTRSLIDLNSGWKIYAADKPDQKTEVSVPSLIASDKEFVFEKELKFSATELTNYEMELVFEGLNYSCKVSLNNVSLYIHTGGSYPFTIKIPKEILNYDLPNVLRLSIKHKLDSRNTIPVKQRFLFPKSEGGIFRDAYIHLVPTIAVTKVSYTFEKAKKANRINLELKYDITKHTTSESSNKNKNYKCYVQFIDTEKSTVLYSRDYNIKFPESDVVEKTNRISLIRPKYWTPKNPQHYFLRIIVSNGDSLIDEFKKQIALKIITKKNDVLFLNGKQITFNGTTYLPPSKLFIQNGYYESLKRDFQIIKNAGFNAVRFANSAPHPYALKLCDDLGLFAFIEIPLNSIPEQITSDDEFLKRSQNYMNNFITSYSNYPSVLAVGVGSSFLPNSNEHKKFIEQLTSIVKSKTNYYTYASFVGIPKDTIRNLDFYGIELYSKDFRTKSFSETSINSHKYFISQATYPTYLGSSNGYLNRFSYEAQAKYFSDIISSSKQNKLSGYFLNSMFDFRGDFAPFYSGYDINKVYKIGILGEDRATDRISYSLIKSKLTKTGKVTVPVGSEKDDSPLFFIIVSLVLSLFLGLIINSKRKFREDAIRALLRPYNFYADIRDQRILSGLNTNALMILLAGSHSLLLTNLLFFLKNNILLEKTVVAFGSDKFVNIINFLAWNPVESFIYLFILSIIMFFFFSIIFQFASFFIKNRVLFSSIYYVVIWAFLPLAVLLPVELVLYRILIANTINFYIYIFLLLYAVWLIQRLLKGIFVIFDTRPSVVYLMSFAVTVVVIGIILFYFQFKDSAIYYIINAAKQYKFISG